jgi:hypothetical protein
MAAAVSERVAWHPETPEQKAAVRTVLAEILATSHFCNSKRYPAFLEYVVNAVLSGHGDELKERTIGIEVFGRRPDYDTNSDTVVRYTAGEVRKRLALYYGEAGHPTPIRIYLPVGSYVPELILTPKTPLESLGETVVLPELRSDDPITHELESLRSQADLHTPEPVHLTSTPIPPVASVTSPPKRTRTQYVGFAVIIASVILLLTGDYLLRRVSTTSGDGDSVLAQFWDPLLTSPGTKLVCSGSVVFAPDRFSGVATATKDADYSFLSIQIAQSIAHLSGYLERHNASYSIKTSASTPLTELRERPVILVGGYNNDWSIRLLEPLRFHFSTDLADPAILDSQQPAKKWVRDRTRNYGSADDYAIVARFTDSMTDGPVVVLAGLGRNGTEAATEFVTSPEFLKKYTSQHVLSRKENIEFVLQSRVVDGKTGAPSILAVYTW